MKGDYWSKGLMLLFGLLIVVVIGYRYYEYMVVKDFIINVNTTCDPVAQSCFISDCSPGIDPGCDGLPYKKIEIRAADAPKCLEEHQCMNFACDSIASCTATYCSADTLEDGESCSEPQEATSPQNNI